MTIDIEQLRSDLLSLGMDEQTADAWLADDQKLGSVSYAASPSPVWWQNEAKLIKVCNELGFKHDIRDVFLNASKRINQTAPAWWHLLAMAARLLLDKNRDMRKPMQDRPRPPVEKWAELSDLFSAMVHFTAITVMMQKHREMGIDPAVTRDTADDLPLRMEEFHNKFGSWGTTDNMHWLTGHLKCTLFKLGRLQFHTAPFGLACIALVNEQGRCVTLCIADRKVRADGQFATADRGIALNAPDNFTTSLTQTQEAITGHVINEQGCIQRETSTFDLTQWQIKLQAGETILMVHIAARDRLDSQACIDSFAHAQSFYKQHFPQVKLAGFCCVSWLMDPQLCSLEQGGSNLGKFIKLFHSVPLGAANDEQMFGRVFDEQTDLKTLPRDTSLRRALIAHMENGGRWRGAAGYRLVQSDVDACIV